MWSRETRKTFQLSNPWFMEWSLRVRFSPTRHPNLKFGQNTKMKSIHFFYNPIFFHFMVMMNKEDHMIIYEEPGDWESMRQIFDDLPLILMKTEIVATPRAFVYTGSARVFLALKHDVTVLREICLVIVRWPKIVRHAKCPYHRWWRVLKATWTICLSGENNQAFVIGRSPNLSSSTSRYVTLCSASHVRCLRSPLLANEESHRLPDPARVISWRSNCPGIAAVLLEGPWRWKLGNI